MVLTDHGVLSYIAGLVMVESTLLTLSHINHIMFTFIPFSVFFRFRVAMPYFVVLATFLVPFVSYAAIEVSTTKWHVCARLETNEAKCWGAGSYGNLGYGDSMWRGTGPNQMGNNLPVINLGTGRTASQIAAGGQYTCARLDTNDVKCWGYGASGRLGYGDTVNRGDGLNEMGDQLPTVNLGTGRTAVEIAVGDSHACARLDTNDIKCWGAGGKGQLGYGDKITRGDGPNEMGDNLPTVNLGTGRTAVQIIVGTSADYPHTCVRLDTNDVKCWGNVYLGYGDILARGDGGGEMGDNLPVIDLGAGRTALEISAGAGTTCARLDNGDVKCWGAGSAGALGQGNTNDVGTKPDQMGDNLDKINLGTGRKALQISTSGSHTCVILDTQGVKCWGEASSGQLGYGDTYDRGKIWYGGYSMGSLPTVDLGTGRKALQIATAGAVTCAVLDTYKIKCWGSGNMGALGYGDTNKRGDNPNEMGNYLPTVDLGCLRGQYSSGSGCMACTPYCSAGHRMMTACNATADLQCTQCNSGFYQAANNFTGNQCTALSNCLAGTHVKANGTLRNDRFCEACASAKFAANANEDACAEWTVCQPGKFMLFAGNASKDRSCKACGTGRFTANANQDACAEWTVCQPGEFVLFTGNASKDRSCKACGTGRFTANANQTNCTEWTTCTATQVETAVGTTTKDRECQTPTTTTEVPFTSTTSVTSTTNEPDISLMTTTTAAATATNVPSTSTIPTTTTTSKLQKSVVVTTTPGPVNVAETTTHVLRRQIPQGSPSELAEEDELSGAARRTLLRRDYIVAVCGLMCFMLN